MNSQIDGWKHLIESGLNTICDALISGREVCLVEIDIELGETLIQKIRDELLKSLCSGDIDDLVYEDCLSRLYLCEGSMSPDQSSQNLLLIKLSFVWTIDYLGS